MDNNDLSEIPKLTMPMIKTHLTDIRLPTASLYQINPDNPNGYLIETDPKFTQKSQWLSSDYLLNALGYDHDLTQKRLGDGFYEQRLINEQINQLTGRRFIEGYQNDLEQYKALMNSGVEYAKRFNLSLGVGLSAEQMSELTTDMVWFVNKEVTLADGRKLTVLTPQVYLVARNSDISANGALISANQIVGNVGGLENSGVIAGRDLTLLATDNLTNRGTILGKTVDLSANQTLVNLGGKIEGVDRVRLSAGELLDIRSTLSSSENADGKFARTQLDQLASIRTTGQNSRIELLSDGKITVKGASIDSSGKLTARADQIEVSTLTLTNREHYQANSDNYYKLDQQAEMGSGLNAKDNISLIGKNDVSLRQAALTSEDGTVFIGSQHGNVTIEEGRAEEQLASGSKSTRKGLLSKKTNINRYAHEIDNAVSSQIQGKQVVVIADEGDVTLRSASVQAEQDITVQAGSNLNVDVAYSTHNTSRFDYSKRSGFGASSGAGVLSVGYSRNKASNTQTEQHTYVNQSQLNSREGNINLIAGDSAALTAALLSAGNNITIQAGSISFNQAQESSVKQLTHEQKSSGIGINLLYNPLAALKEDYNRQASQGSAQSIVGQSYSFTQSLEKLINANPMSAYIKANRSKLQANGESHRAVVNEVRSGGDFTAIATEGDIRTQGGYFGIEGNAYLKAAQNIDLGVSESWSRQGQQRKAKGAYISTDNQQIDKSVGAYHQKETGDLSQFEQEGTTFSVGGQTILDAEQGNLTLKNTTLVSQDDIFLSAGQDIEVTTAVNRRSQFNNDRHQSIGEAVVSQTERFSGYQRDIRNQDGSAQWHNGSSLISLDGSVFANAGRDYRQTSSEVLAKDRIYVDAEQIQVTAAYQTEENHSHTSQLRMGNFKRVISPVIDLINAAEDAVRGSQDEQASNRLKAAQAIRAAAQGYTLANSLQGADNAVLFRAETGTGYSHSRSDQTSESQISLGNRFNAREILFNSRSGDIDLTHTDLTSRDGEGKRLADSRIELNSARDIFVRAGEDRYKQTSKSQNSGLEVGTAVSVGAKTGWSVYGKVGYGSSKQNNEGTFYHNSQIDTEHLMFNSQGDTTLQGVTAKAKRIDAAIQGTLRLESLQDSQSQSNSGVNAGIKVEFGFGTAWDFAFNASGEKGGSNYRQVNEQTGLFAEEGGYHITANHVHLEGAAIAGTNPANSELRTNAFTFNDLQNSSGYQAMSGAIGGNVGNKLNDKNTGNEKNTANGKNANAVSEKNTASLSGGLPLSESGNSQSLTKAVLTEGTIILNKDSDPTVTDAKSLGIATQLENANGQVNKPKDTAKLLSEQKAVQGAVADLSAATASYANQKAKAAEENLRTATEAYQQAEAGGDEEQTAKAHLAELQAINEQASWANGGDKRRYVQTATALFSSLLAGQSAEGVVAATLSPTVNNQIAKIDDPVWNMIAHGAWGAVEGKAGNGNALGGALSSMGAEFAAQVFAEALYHKTEQGLSEEEKQKVIALSGLVGAAISAGTQGGDSVTLIQNSQQGSEIAQNTVKNNYLSDWQKALFAQEYEACDDLLCKIRTVAYWRGIDVGQDGSLLVGVAASLPEGVYESAEGIIQLASSPIETLNAMYQLVKEGNLASHIKEGYLERIDTMKRRFEDAGFDGAYDAGKELGHLLQDTAGLLAGGYVAVKGAVKVGGKAVAGVAQGQAVKEFSQEIAKTESKLPQRLTCSFRGDMEVKTAQGYKPIANLHVGDKVFAKNELTGITGYQQVQAHYSNPYEFTVYIHLKDSQGTSQTIVSNKVHPFFAQVWNEQPQISAGHNYQGKIKNAYWVNAEHLKAGYKLLGERGDWQEVQGIEIKPEQLTAFNLTVEQDHTYFVRGLNPNAEGVWVHNDCWHALPTGAKRVADIDGKPAYQFKDNNGQDVVVVKHAENRFETISHGQGQPHYNSLSQEIHESTGRYVASKDPIDDLYPRVYLRSATLEKIYSQYEKLPNGDYFNSVSQEIIKGPIDIGHVYGWEHRRLSLAAQEINLTRQEINLTRQEFIDYVNARPENFRLENMSINRSHVNEMPGKDQIDKIKKDMESFLERGR